jgi:hypothetical protein
VSDETERYLCELARALPRRRRRRIVAEIRYHLEASVMAARTEGISDDHAERDAISRLGPPDRVAEGFAHDRAERSVFQDVGRFRGVSVVVLSSTVVLAVGLTAVAAFSTERSSKHIASRLFIPIPNTSSPCGCTRPIPPSHGRTRLEPIETGGAIVALNPKTGAIVTAPGSRPRAVSLPPRAP